MIAGVLGGLITMERAVGSGWRWAYIAPALAGAGSVSLLLVSPLEPAKLLFAASSFTLALMFAVFMRRVFMLPLAILLLGAALWLAGNLLWIGGDPLTRVTPWWVAFLVVTILGERLEVTAYMRRPRRAQVLFLLALTPLIAGLIVTRIDQQNGEQVAGVGMILLVAWLARYDIARRAIFRPEPTRFIGLSLLAGYVWLAIGGFIWVLAPQLDSPWVYDATLHPILLGFVFSMVFGHALIILPGTLRLHIDFHRRFYAHLALLHASVALRFWGDLGPDFDVRRWSGVLSATAILLFVVSTMAAVRSRRSRTPREIGSGKRARFASGPAAAGSTLETPEA